MTVPDVVGVRTAISLLRWNGLLEFRHGLWWKVRPTEAGYARIKVEKETQRAAKARAWRGQFVVRSALQGQTDTGIVVQPART